MKTSTTEVHYIKGLKFQTTRTCRIKTAVLRYNIQLEYCRLTADGWLVVYRGYAWDGASGGIDTKSTIRASLAHDVLYQLMREEVLPQREKVNADLTLSILMKNDKALLVRAWLWLLGVRWAGEKYTDPRNKREELVAP